MPRKIANLANEECSGHRHFISPAKLFAQFKSSRVPEGGWNAEVFRGEAGVALVRDQVNVQRMAKLKGARLLAPPLTLLLRGQVLKVIEVFQSRYLRVSGQRSLGGKAITGVITTSQHSELWAQAIEEAFAGMDASVTATVRPALQSVADDVLTKTTTLLTGDKPSLASVRVMKTQVNEIALQVTRINETTRASSC